MDPRLPMDSERVGIGDAARYLGVHPQTLLRPGNPYPRPTRIGARRDRRYSTSELRAFVEREREP